MLSWPRIENPLGAIVGVGFVIFLAVASAFSQEPAPTPSKESQPPQSQTAESNNAATNDQRGTEHAPLVIKILPATDVADNTASKENKELKKSPPDDKIARFTEFLFYATAALAVIGIVQACVFVWQGIQLWRAVNASRDEFLATHRPMVIVRQFQVDPIVPDSPIRITFSVINTGNTDATLRLLATEVALWNCDRQIYEAPGIDPVQRPITDEGIRILPNGRRVSFTAESRFAVTETQSDAIDQDRMLLRCIGELTYADKRGTDRRTGFHRTYDVHTDLFTESINLDQEYQD